MEAFFYTVLLISVIGWLLSRNTIQRQLFYNHDHIDEQFKTDFMKPTIWIPVKYQKTKPAKIKVKFLGNPAQALAHDLEIVTDRAILASSYEGYSYREILESLTPEQITDIKELRSFLI